MKSLKLALLLVTLLAWGRAAYAQDSNRIGAGANYWVALDDLEGDDVDDSGISYLISYQHRTGLLGLELDVEFLPDRFGQDAIAPEAYLLIGNALYAGAGIGVVHGDDGFADEPFFALKAGFDLELLPSLYLDISGNYRFNDETQFKDSDTNIDTDTIFLGAAVRVGF